MTKSGHRVLSELYGIERFTKSFGIALFSFKVLSELYGIESRGVKLCKD